MERTVFMTSMKSPLAREALEYLETRIAHPLLVKTIEDNRQLI
jgi:hypothetical protein